MTDRTPAPRSGGSHPIEPEHKKRPWWLLLLIAAVAVVILLLLLSRCGGDDPDEAAGGEADDATASAASSPTSSPSPTTATTGSTAAPTETTGSATPSTATPTPTDTGTPAPTSTSPGPGDTAGAGAGTLTAGSTILLPMSGATPASNLVDLVGQPVTAQGVQVLAVPADEGFWVGTSMDDRVWIQLTGGGESPYQVQVGDAVDFTGTVARHNPGFAARIGVDAQEGAAQLTGQKAHVKADRSTLQLSAN